MSDQLEFRASLPDDVGVEREVIGWAMRDRFYGQLAALAPDDFHAPEHADVWTCVQAIAAAGKAVTVVNVVSELVARGANRETYGPLLGEYAGDLVSSLAIPDYVARLKDLAKRRRAMFALGGMLDGLEDLTAGSVAEDQIGKAVAALASVAGRDCRLVGLGEIAGDYLEGRRAKVSPTGFPKLDAALAGGLHRNRYYGFAGRMKAGKTMFMVSMSANMAALGTRHVYLCLEMRPAEIGQRYLARHMGVNALAFLDEERRNAPWFVKRLCAARDHFRENDCVRFKPYNRTTLDDLRATIAAIGLSGEYDGVFVDYVQLIQGKRTGENETNHLDNVNQTLAELAAAYPLWIVAGAQLNDEGGVRGGKGMAAACDVLFNLEDSDPPDKVMTDASGRKVERRHLSMEFSRYTMVTDIGQANRPGYELRTDAGPYFEEL